jgi:hypothetical protein
VLKSEVVLTPEIAMSESSRIDTSAEAVDKTIMTTHRLVPAKNGEMWASDGILNLVAALSRENAELLKGQELLKQQTVRIRQAIGDAQPGEDTEAAAKRLRAKVAALQRALRGVYRVLDGMDIWSDHDVRANACSAFCIAQDALGAYTGNTTEEPSHD